MTSHNLPTPVFVPPVAELAVVPAETPPSLEAAPPSVEQARVADRLFERADAESQQVAALLGLWVSATVGHQLLADHLQREEEDPVPLDGQIPAK